MTRDPVGRRDAGIADSIRKLDVGTILAIILVGGLAVRVFIAAVYLPLSGLSNDIASFAAWGQRMASIGPGGFYDPTYFADYPPGYMYVLWFLGEIGGALRPLVGVDATAGLVKIPGILSDIGIGWLLFQIGRRWGGELVDRTHVDVSPTTLGLAAATVYVFNPGVIFDSAVWGQVDAVGTLVLLATVYALGRGWTEAAAAGAVLALLLKFQFAFLIPVVAVVGLKRHLLGRSTDPAHARRDLLRVLTSLATAVVTLAVLLLPFGMLVYRPLAGGDPRGLLGILPEADPVSSLIGKLVEAANTYEGLTVNAFNLWRNPWSGLGDSLGFYGNDTGVAIALGGLSLTWQHVGTLLFAAAAILALVCVARRDDMRGILLASLVLAIAFFVLPTRVHERYLFPALAFAAPLLFAGRAWPWIYGGLSIGFFANIYWAYTDDWSFALPRIINPGADGQPMPQDPILGAALLSDGGIWLVSAGLTVLLGVVIWRAVRHAAAAPIAAAASAPSEPEPPSTPRVEPRPPRSVDALPSGGRRTWLSPNPADAYLREPMRGLERRDALIAIALVVFALVFRLWRLDVPRHHHFDEVYHARSAAEFLSAWEHGWNRDVYEWTHPMLAKYLIAAGIVAVDPNRIVGERELGGPSNALAVAPRRASVGHERSILFSVEDGSEIVATDATTGDEVARWVADGQVASLAYDPEAVRLLVGRADSGVVAAYELAGLLASPDGRAPPEGPSIDSGLASVVEIRIQRYALDPILLRGLEGVATIDREADGVRTRATGAYGGVAFARGETDTDPNAVVVSEPSAGRVLFLDEVTLEPLEDGIEGTIGEVGVDATLVGPILAHGDGDDREILALTGGLDATDEHPATAGGIAVIDADGSNSRCGDDPCTVGIVPLPGPATLIGLDHVANLVYVAGAAPDGTPQVWTVEPHFESRGDGSIGMAAYDTTTLPASPIAMAFDIASTSQADDHGRLLVGTGDGSIVRIEIGNNAFAWRISGVVFGSVLVGLIYLLCATMFSRRRIGVLAAGFVAIDGMSFVMSRISMNDIFVATFIVAAYVAFWQIWSGRWARSAWWVLPLVGVLIGLAAATKWVGFYALAGLWVLVLARSGLGRLLLVVLAVLALVIGAVGGPWPFLLVMLAIVALALLITWARPIRFDVREALTALTASAVVLIGVTLAFVVAFDQVEGARTPRSAIEYLFGLLARGAQVGWPVWLMIGIAGVLLAWRAWLSLRRPRSDARWFEPGEMGGFAWSWVAACLVVIPLVVYGLSYIPYLQLGHDWAIGGGPGYGWSVDELHAQMFGYHFNLKAGHDSASPWWSWPLMLKPTWFLGDSFDNDMIAVIYNGGNPVLFWAGVPALVACGILAWRRRSMALVLVVVAFAFQFVPWIRIERATFAYHYLTAVLFAMVAVAYCVDELLRRPAWRDLAIGYLVLVVIVGIAIYPLGSALPMPDWYINAARALPPWNFGFQFPDPPQGERAELIVFGAAKAALGLAAAMAAAAFGVWGRRWWEQRRSAPVGEAGAGGPTAEAG